MIIGLGNKARNGKDMLGSVLSDKYGYRVYRFGDAVKEECRQFGWTEERKNALYSEFREAIYANYGIMPEPDPMTTLLQFWGNYRRSFDKDYWVKRVMREIVLDDSMMKAVITDMRYKNEAAWIENFGGMLFRVNRIMEDGSRYIDPFRDANNISEIDLDNVSLNEINIPNSNDSGSFLFRHFEPYADIVHTKFVLHMKTLENFKKRGDGNAYICVNGSL